MARITRKELKTDKFALEVGHTVDFFEEHQREFIRYGIVAAVVIALAVGVYWYRSHQQVIRQQALAAAIEIQEAPVGPAPAGTPVTFPTQEAKDKAAIEAFSNLVAKYPGSDEGLVAEYYLGSIMADDGKMDEAVKRYQEVADSGNKNYASLAKLALARIYFDRGETDKAAGLLRPLIKNPTGLVSTYEATFALARGLAKTNPAEARKLLEPLRTSQNSEVSQAAIQLYGELGTSE